MKVKIELAINRTSGRDDNRPISVRIGDSISGCHFLEANFRLDDFMEILTGRGGITGEGDYYPDVPVGCTQESKEEIIPRPKSYKESAEDDEILAPFEVRGWKARRSDLHNPHHWVGTDKVRVLFTRFIRPDGGVWGVS